MRRVVLVTGTSSGIGLQLALALAARPFTVIATLRRLDSAPPQLYAAGCDVQPLDVTSQSSAESLTDYVLDKYDGCDVLINNAGWGVPGTIETVPISLAKDVFETNVWGVMRMTQLITPLIRKKGGGLIVTVSSTSGWRGLPCADIYTASKFAVEGMMDSFRYSVRKDGIKVVMVNPGPTDTSYSDRFEREWMMREEACEVVKRFVGVYVEKLARRNKEGQDARECAERIVRVVEGGGEKFSNPTSAFGEEVLKGCKVCSDGVSGVYEGIVREADEVLAEIVHDMDGKEGGDES